MTDLAAVIFGFNGVLVDTVTMTYEAYRDALAKQNIVLSFTDYSRFIGSPSYTKMREILAYKNIRLTDEQVAELIKDKNSIYKNLQATTDISMPAASNFLRKLIQNKREIKIGLVSSAPLPQLLISLERIGFSQHDFDAIVTCSDILNTANLPQVSMYTAIANKLGIAVDNCLVFEDCGAAVNEVNEAGMVAVAVPNLYTKNDDFSNAAAIVDFYNLDMQSLVNLYDKATSPETSNAARPSMSI